MGFQKVAKIADLWSGEMMGVEVNGERILLVNVDDHIYAYADTCPHQKSRLSEGTLTDKILRCARHHWEFDVCSGSGLNPQNSCLTVFPVRLTGDDILVDIDAVTTLGAGVEGGTMMTEEVVGVYDRVGPVLQSGTVANAIVAAIKDLNQDVMVVDRGAYVRVLVPQSCVVTRSAIEEHLGRSFRFPGELETVMSAFKGSLQLNQDDAAWRFAPTHNSP